MGELRRTPLNRDTGGGVIDMQGHETFKQKMAREDSERDVVDFLAPGIPDEMAAIYRQMSTAADNFYAGMMGSFARIAQLPQTRLEWAARCVNIPAPIIGRLVEDLGHDDIERLLAEIERGVAELRAAAKLRRSGPDERPLVAIDRAKPSRE